MWAWQKILDNKDGLLTGAYCLGLYSKGYRAVPKGIAAASGDLFCLPKNFKNGIRIS